jgi:uncharacterized protein (TIGR02001 family)
MQQPEINIRSTTAVCYAATSYAMLAAALLTAASCIAQTSGSVSLVSDYRFRGVSLSQGHPEPQIHLGYDGKSGWYAGAFASGARLDAEGNGNAHLMGYAGYFQRLSSGFGWELGASKSLFFGASDANYAEVFAGLASNDVSGRLYLSPDYYGSGIRTLYAEVNGSYQVRRRLHVLGHVGFLQALSGRERSQVRPGNRYDVRIGASASLGDWNVQLAWTAVEKSGASRSYYGMTNPAWTLNAAYSF